MQKPNNYENTTTGSKFTPFFEGGHKLQILDITECVSSKGKNMLLVKFDATTDDKQPGYFTKQFQTDTRVDKKWPIAGTAYITTEDASGNCSKPLKSFITCLCNSNKGWQPTWGDQFCARIRGLRIGGIFGMEEYINKNGGLSTTCKLRYWCAFEDATTQPAPEAKKVIGYVAPPAPTNVPTDNNGFISVEGSIDEELPFA